MVKQGARVLTHRHMIEVIDYPFSHLEDVNLFCSFVSAFDCCCLVTDCSAHWKSKINSYKV